MFEEKPRAMLHCVRAQKHCFWGCKSGLRLSRPPSPRRPFWLQVGGAPSDSCNAGSGHAHSTPLAAMSICFGKRGTTAYLLEMALAKKMQLAREIGHDEGHAPARHDEGHAPALTPALSPHSFSLPHERYRLYDQFWRFEPNSKSWWWEYRARDFGWTCFTDPATKHKWWWREVDGACFWA